MMKGRRILAFFAFWLIASSASAAERLTVNYEYLQQRARELAAKPYDDNWGRVPESLRTLDYNAYHEIRFNPLKALWADEALPFQIQFNHPGGLFSRSVRIHEFTENHVQEVRFASEFFDYGSHRQLAQQAAAATGYAGFQIYAPLNQANEFEEFAVFLGANYFRVIARGQRHGISARGLALNTTHPDGEEFPAFREFWLGKPNPNDPVLTVYALQDSPSAAGAYRFDLRPGPLTVVRVYLTLYFRYRVEQVGIAPFSSMFYFGENTLHKPPAVRSTPRHRRTLFARLYPHLWPSRTRHPVRLWRPLSRSGAVGRRDRCRHPHGAAAPESPVV